MMPSATNGKLFFGLSVASMGFVSATWKNCVIRRQQAVADIASDPANQDTILARAKALNTAQQNRAAAAAAKMKAPLRPNSTLIYELHHAVETARATLRKAESQYSTANEQFRAAEKDFQTAQSVALEIRQAATDHFKPTSDASRKTLSEELQEKIAEHVAIGAKAGAEVADCLGLRFDERPDWWSVAIEAAVESARKATRTAQEASQKAQWALRPLAEALDEATQGKIDATARLEAYFEFFGFRSTHV